MTPLGRTCFSLSAGPCPAAPRACREFDFKVDYAIDDNPDSGSSLLMAVQDRLGLKLEAAKGPVDTLVVDRAAKPSAN